MRIYPVKENPIGLAVSKILWYKHTDKHTSCYFSIRIFGLSTKKFGFTMVLYEKKMEMLSIFWCNIIKCFDEFKLFLKALTQKYIILIKNVYLEKGLVTCKQFN